MTNAAYEDSRYLGTPVEVYKFTYGAGPNDYFAYTDAERQFTLSGVDYVPIPIKRDGIESGGGRTERRDIRVQMSTKEALLDLFQIYPPDQPISVVIKSGHFDDPDQEFTSVFTGVIINVKNKADGWADVLCRPLWVASQQGGLRRNYQLGCPHVLYGSQCGASVISVSATVASFPTINKVSLLAGWEGAYAPAKFRNGGYVQWDVGSNTYRRTILSVSGNTLTLSGPVTGLVAGDPMTVVIGCNRQMDDCGTLHNNINNFGGQPWIPTKNPVNTNPYG
jgi:hypothetical protein